MAKVTWPHREAQRLAHRVRDTDRPVVFETGYGPSGLPHIGTFAEVARTTFVMNAFKHDFPEIETQLIVFSDDMDGLRSLPENIPNHEMLRSHLGMPLSSIPDPFGKESTFAEYMNKQLQSFLDYYGFEYEFRSSTNTYKSGVFDEGLKRIMDHYEVIRELFTSTISEDKRKNWSPLFPTCESCGGIYTTRVTSVDKGKYQVSYVCDQTEEHFKPCGHESNTEITGGKVKVGWKVDWALRWFTFGVNYEMYGKDLIDSASMSSRICSILGGTPPTAYKYELFLDENGAKISKKIGNGISMNQWQAYAPLGALLHFLLENPNKARRMGLPILPRLVDDYINALRAEDKSSVHGHLWFIDRLLHHHDASGLKHSDVGYAILVNVAASLGIHDGDVLYEYAARYDAGVQQNEPFFRELCKKAVAYVQDYEERLPAPTLDVDISLVPYLAELRKAVEELTSSNLFCANELQNAVFAVAKKNNLDQKNWFKFLYASLLGKDKGPRIGTFFAILGPQRVFTMIDDALKQHIPASIQTNIDV